MSYPVGNVPLVPGSRLRLVPYGPPATAALAEVVDEAKGGDPLAPVTVVPPGTFAALSLRRVLTMRHGVANVRFMPLARVAELVGAPRLADADQRPLSSAVRRAAVRAALRDEPGIFAEVARDPATVQALDDTFRELRPLGVDDLDRLGARGERSAEVVRIFRATRTRLDGFYDERDVMEAAAAGVAEGDAALADLGAVVLHLPRSVDPAGERLLVALSAGDALHVVLGLTGDDEADAISRTLADRFEPRLGTPSAAPAEIPVADRIIHAPDPEEEVRTAVRGLPQLARDDVSLYRVAFVSPAPTPYPAIAADVLAEAGLPHHGLDTATLARSTAGRIVLGAVDLAAGALPRHEVMAWLHSAPIVARPPDTLVPSDRWDRRSRQAGITGGAGQWNRRLRVLAERRRQRADVARDEGEPAAADRHEQAATECEELAVFIDELRRRLTPPAGGGWSGLAQWTATLLHRYGGGEAALARWPDHELEAHRRVEAVLDGLTVLDEIDPDPDVLTLRAVLADELDAPAPREHRFGEGVLVARIRDLAGVDVDAVRVMGAVEGVLPTRRSPGVLVDDDDREALDGVLERPAERRAHERRDFLAALMAGATSTLSAPRADVRAGRPVQPAPWFLEAAARRHGEPVHAETLAALSGQPWFDDIASAEGALRATPEHASLRDRDLAELLAPGSEGASVPGLEPGLAVMRARSGNEAGPWDGVVGAAAELGGRSLSPTSLEGWAECPFRYFLAHVLGIEELDDPEDIETLPANERGSLVHEILDRFVGERLGDVDADTAWTDADHRRLDEIADACFEEWEDRGLTGRALLWEIERSRIRRELHLFLDRDQQARSETRMAPVATELAFTERSGGPVEVALPDGRSVHLRGYIDRLDATPDGSRLRVIDYKTGTPIERSKQRNPFRPDPFREGTKLQLPIYALAARRHHGTDVPVDAEYWYVNERWDFKREQLPVDDALLADFAELLGRIVTGVEGGVFPAYPGIDDYDPRTGNDTWKHCKWCPYDRVCPVDRGENWDRKRDHPAIAPYRAVVDVEEPPS